MRLVVEVDDPKSNSSLFFRPLSRNLRGAFSYGRVARPEMLVRSLELPDLIPGLRVEIDTDAGRGAVIEPLWEERFTDLRKRLVKACTGKRSLEPIPLDDPPRAEFALAPPHCEIPTILYWIKRGLDAGKMRLVEGKAPTDEECRGAKRDFFRSNDARPIPVDAARDTAVEQLTALVRQQADQIQKLLAGRPGKASG